MRSRLKRYRISGFDECGDLRAFETNSMIRGRAIERQWSENLFEVKFEELLERLTCEGYGDGFKKADGNDCG